MRADWQRVWRTLRGGERRQATLDFSTEVVRIEGAVRSRLENYKQILHSGVALFSASEDVTRDEWRDFISSLQVGRRFPGTQGIGFSLLVAPDDLPSHIEQLKSEGFTDYRVWPSGQREMYTSIVFLEPFDERIQRAFGYDMMSESTRRLAMERARNTGAPATSEKVTLVQESGDDAQSGILVYLPVYRGSIVPSSEASRQAALFGFVYGVFRMDDMMRGILGPTKTGTQLTIYDGFVVSAERRMYATHQSEDAGQLSRTVRVDFGGRIGTLEVTSQSSHGFEARWSASRTVLVGGLLLSGLATALLIILATSRSQALELAETVTEALRASESNVVARQRLNPSWWSPRHC